MNKKILVLAGASGVVGRHIIQHALSLGFHIKILSREVKKSDKNVEYIEWHPGENSSAWLERVIYAVDNADMLVNLAGASIAAGRLNHAHQEIIVSSRIKATQTLILAYQKCKKPPKVWIQISAIGYYGNTGEFEISEKSPRGNLFLSNVCEKWENELNQLKEIKPGTRVIIARLGMVLAKDAPAWKKLLQPVKFGLGGALGTGKQWISWIAAEDIANAIFFLSGKKSASGVYNFTSPFPTRQIELIKTAAKILQRPHFFKTPAFLIRLIIGKLADEIILASCKALPAKLISEGYIFLYPEIERAIKRII